MRHGGRLLLALPLAAGLVAAEPRPAQTQGTSEAPSLEELQREIEQLRRLSIGELQREVGELRQRIEALERQAAAAAPAPPEAAPPEAAPPAEGEERAEVAAPAEPPPAEIGAIAATEEEVERALERALIQTGVLLLPAGAAEIVPSFSYARQDAPVFSSPVFPSEDGGQVVAADEVRSDGLETSLALRLGLPLDSQLQVDVPYRYQSESFVTLTGPGAPREESRNRSGFGDVGVTFTKALLRERERGWRPNLFGGVRWDTDTGGTDDGIPLGSGFHELSGSLTASKRQDPLVFVGGVGYSTSFEEDGVDPGDGIGFSIGAHLAASPQTSLRFFVSQSFVDEVELDGREIPGSDLAVGTFVVGASSILSPRVLVDVAAGFGLTEDAPDYFISVSLPVQFDLPFRLPFRF